MLISTINNNFYGRKYSSQSGKNFNKIGRNTSICQNNLTHPLSFNRGFISSHFGTTPEFKKFIYSPGEVNMEEYNEIKQKFPELLTQAGKYIKSHNIFNNIIQTPKDTAQLAVKIKEHFDNSYGENNYVILSVGTSPAFVTEPLSALGEEIIFVPVSKVSHTPFLSSVSFKNDLNKYFKLYPKAKIIAEYIKNKLSDTDLDNNKKVIIMDFESSGSTLALMKQILLQYCNIPLEQIRICEISKEIQDVHDKNHFKITPEGYIVDIVEERIAKISNVPHYDITYDGEFSGINKPRNFNSGFEKRQYYNTKQFSRPFARAFQLLVLDELSHLDK